MKFILTTLLLLAVPLLAAAQLISNPYPPVPAAMAVAGAYTAAASGAEAPYWNPAGLAFSKGSEGRFAYQQPWSIAAISHLSAAGFTELPRKYGGIGVGVQTLGTRMDGHTMAAETEAYVSHGIMLQQDIHSSLAFGYTLKLINYDLGQSVADDQGVSENLGSASTFGLDVGATAQLWDRFKLGGSFKNINHPQFGSGLKRDLPRMISGGVSYFPYYGVRTTFDVERVISGDTQFKGGINAQVIKPLDLRFGVMTNPNSFTAGFGLHWHELVIDYAFIYHTILNPSHLIGIGFNLDPSLQQIWEAKGEHIRLSDMPPPSPPAPPVAQPKVLDIPAATPKTAEVPPPPPPPSGVYEVPSNPVPVTIDTFGNKGQALPSADDRTRLQDIAFAKSRSDLRSGEMDKIKANAEILKRNPNWQITLVGHTDPRGNKKLNLALGKRRAGAVKKALVHLGIKASRIIVTSVNGDEPVDPGNNESAWAKNRRVEIQVR